ncbi:MAG: FHA protein [Gammaproteobacteria bacterium]|nr:FHA protein [Gammaproteobacteria bacterium]
MLNKFFAKPVELKIGEQTFKFSSINDFDFCMTGRTSVPSKKIIEMVKFTADQLKNEAKTIKDIEKRFVSILSKSIEDTDSINRAMRELDPLIFSQDHSWRQIISALNAGDEELNPFRRLALVKYMQYLSSRQEIIKYLYSDKKKLSQEPNDSISSSAEFKDTIILDNTLVEGSADGKDHEVERMPKGEVVTVTLKPNEEIEILLSKHVCKLSYKDKLEFTDQSGRIYKLHKGRNVVGRDSASNIIMEPRLRDISRLHLVIEYFGENTVQLTDLSSHGTSIPRRFVEQHSG